MEPRLVPVNAVIGLLTHGDVNSAALADAGFELAGLEVPVLVGPGSKVTIDALLLQPTENRLVLCESKSGANIDGSQAKRYTEVDAQAVVQAAHVTLPRRANLSTEVLYVCLAPNVERVQQGLQTAGVQCPVLVVHDDKVVLENASAASAVLRGAFEGVAVPLAGPPPRLIAFDHDSPLEVIEPFVRAQLVALLARRVPQVTMPVLTELTTPYAGLYGRGARNQLVRRVADVVRQMATEDPATFAFVPSAANRDAFVRLLRTPEDNDPRGRTQAYQALARRRDTRRRALPADPNQLDLLHELDEAAELVSAEDDPGTTSEEEMP